jgi:hypothetical protein
LFGFDDPSGVVGTHDAGIAIRGRLGGGVSVGGRDRSADGRQA